MQPTIRFLPCVSSRAKSRGPFLTLCLALIGAPAADSTSKTKSKKPAVAPLPLLRTFLKNAPAHACMSNPEGCRTVAGGKASAASDTPGKPSVRCAPDGAPEPRPILQDSRSHDAISPNHDRTTRLGSQILDLAAIAALIACVILLSGCASYVNSPRAAAYRAKASADFTHPLIARAYNAKPAMRFPATIGLAPMDAESQLPLRALDAAGKLDALKSLPQLANTVNVSSLLISTNGELPGPDGKPAPIWNKSDLSLREAAARLHCDAVLLLKIDSTVTDGKVFAPLSLVTLGMFPNDRTEVISTALAALVDTRTGYVYATAERSAGKTCHAISWDDSTRDKTMRLANQKAMEKLFTEFPALWAGIVAKHRP